MLTGFKAGVGFVIVVDQLPKLLGIHFDKGGFFQNVASIVTHVPELSVPTLAVALGTFAIIVLSKQFLPKAPAPLFAVGAGIAASAFLGLQAAGVSVVGAIQGGMPALQLPKLGLVEAMWPAAAGVALIAFTESIAAARAFAKSTDPAINANRELFALGAANVAGAFIGSMPSGGGTSQTAVAATAGARSQAYSLVVAGVALATLLFLAPVLALMPNATLAAVVIAYSLGLLDPAQMIAIRRVRTMEFRWAVAACLGVMVLGTLQRHPRGHRALDGGTHRAAPAIRASTRWGASRARTSTARARRSTRRTSRSRGSDRPPRGPPLLRQRRERRREAEGPRERSLAARAPARFSPRFPDSSTRRSRRWWRPTEKLQHEGIELWLAALNPEALELVRATPLAERLGRERMFFTVEDAVNAYEKRGAGKAP